ncbi:Protein CBG03080, partial [Caenorhabditis briggsae]
ISETLVAFWKLPEILTRQENLKIRFEKNVSRELNLVEKKIEENAMARSRELLRLLNAYNKITKSEEDPSDHPPSQSIIIPEQV